MEKRDLKQEYEDMINGSKIFLFMKGTPEQPQCGFSMRVVNILSEFNVVIDYRNILEDMELREAVKEFANWPTYPQLYVNGELLGGCEIIETMQRNGELEEALNS